MFYQKIKSEVMGIKNSYDYRWAKFLSTSVLIF